jgi:phage tail sheath protein FI
MVTHTSADVLKYGAAYFPYVRTTLRFVVDDASVTIAKATDTRPAIGGGTVDEENAALSGKTLADSGLQQGDPGLYSQIRALVDQVTVTMPPSGAVAGLYSQTDRTSGVWKAPANATLWMVTGPAVAITNEMQDKLHIDANTGKSVNAIRNFPGRGTLVWGARTLAGNDGEWRYVAVRRFANFVEESVAKAMAPFAFEPNDATTWVKVRAMIENFLTTQWRNGALQGTKPEQAFWVAVDLGKTMRAQDILDGVMIVEVGLAMVRPAEFIVLRFTQKMPPS